jgi:excisionase family DNA binding protein
MTQIILQNTTQAQLKSLISASIAEALESLREELKSTSVSTKLTREQVKEDYHISFPTILKLEKQGKLKGYRIGRRVLFDRTEVEGALTSRDFR